MVKKQKTKRRTVDKIDDALTFGGFFVTLLTFIR